MKVTAVVLYKGALTYYTVTDKGENGYEAHLLEYKGTSENMPPQELVFIKDGRHCTGDSNYHELMDDIYYAVNLKFPERGPLFTGNNPRSPYVSI